MENIITVPCDTCAHCKVCVYERAMRDNATCLREVANDLQSVAVVPFTVNIDCGHYLKLDPISQLSVTLANIRGGDT